MFLTRSINTMWMAVSVRRLWTAIIGFPGEVRGIPGLLLFYGCLQTLLPVPEAVDYCELAATEA
jgi:hypothetical protein